MKMDMTAVAREHRARNERIIKASRLHMPGIDDDGDACEALALALLELAEMWREDAHKAMDENKRGCKGVAESLRDCATRVSGVAIALRQHGLPLRSDATDAAPKGDVPAEGEPSPAGSEPSISPAVPPDLADPVFTVKSPDLTQAFLAGVGNGPATDLYMKLAGPPALEETLAEAASSIIEQVTQRRAAEEIDPRQVKIIKQAEIKSISLVSDPLPGLEGNFTIVDMATTPAQNAIAAGFTPVPDIVTFTITTADPVPSWALQPQVPVLELTDLEHAGPNPWQPIPDHASVSQAQLMGECGLKYWLRYRRGAPERPSWAMVGGSTLHTCIEEVERDIARGANPSMHESVVKGMWLEHFAAQISRTQAENPLFSIETWHASKSGKEDRAWWDADGPEMVHRYLEWRAKWTADGWELLHDSSGPIVEREFLIFLGGKPVKGFVDQAWYHPQRELVAILDAKSGASAPPDYFQPAVYALALGQKLNLFNAYAQATYVGGYWDARKGELMAPGLVELEKRHPRAEIEHRFATLNVMNSAGIYMPNTNSAYGGCGSCSLKRSCPIGSRMSAGIVG